ncbi:MAG: LVIVD repeat-containing protein [Bacteroidota bacterium]
MTNTRYSLQKSQLLALVSILCLLPFLFSACEDQQIQTITWTEFEPVYMSEQEFLNSVELQQPRDLEVPGKIYFYDGYLFVNERNKGVHIIDNRDPASPSNVGFINIPANKDIAVEGENLYADSQKDLLVFDISDLQNPELTERIEDVFNTAANIAPGFTTHNVDQSNGLVVDWKKVEKEEICEDDCRSHPQWNWRTTGGVTFDSANSFAAESGGNGGGVGGSLARFAINNGYLYAVDHTDLITFSIQSGSTNKINQNSIGWAIETIFPYNDNLFIGSESAMYIYELGDPSAPQQLSVYWHATACDPVVVEGDYAYVTLRESERCPQGVNRLEVVDVADLSNPKKAGFYNMISPHGLGIDDGRLFVSEGEHGLKIMDATDPLNIQLLRHIEDIEAYDVIPFNNVLMVTGDTGIIQYDYSDIEDLIHLSTIPVFGTQDENI